MPSPVAVAPTAGICLTALFFQALLYGMGVLQIFLYFLWYHKDDWMVKGTVLTMFVVETIQLAAAFSTLNNWLIVNFGNSADIDIIHWQDMVQLAAVYLSTFIAQAHFARSLLHKQAPLLPPLILLLSLLALGAGIAQVVLATRIERYSELGPTTIATEVQAAATLAADVLITAGLCWHQNNNRTRHQSNNRALNLVIITAINRGVCTLAFAALNIILFVARPGTLDFMLALLVSDKLYMNSMLAILNTRPRPSAFPNSELSTLIFEPNPRLGTDDDESTSALSTLHETRVRVRNDELRSPDRKRTS
ncbi:hypothetical protein C8R44DRAFT_794670 [Mycena epipterygia]|nr:hypothetical protein C8R44DRAFT_794670 [Mycena epipterygia]